MRRLFLLLAAATVLGGAAPLAQSLEADHGALIAALRKDHVLVSARRLLRVGYVCSLRLGDQSYPVVEVIEQVRGAMEPKDVSRVVLLTPELKPVWQAGLFSARPLSCKGNTLFFTANVRTADGAEGNEASFFFGGQAVKMREIDPSDLPAEKN